MLLEDMAEIVTEYTFTPTDYDTDCSWGNDKIDITIPLGTCLDVAIGFGMDKLGNMPGPVAGLICRGVRIMLTNSLRDMAIAKIPTLRPWHDKALALAGSDLLSWEDVLAMRRACAALSDDERQFLYELENEYLAQSDHYYNVDQIVSLEQDGEEVEIIVGLDFYSCAALILEAHFTVPIDISEADLRAAIEKNLPEYWRK